MEFVCKNCWHKQETEPGYSEGQEKIYFELEEKVNKAKKKRFKISIPGIIIGLGIVISGGVFLMKMMIHPGLFGGAWFVGTAILIISLFLLVTPERFFGVKFGELERNRWNYSFTCQYCGEENRFWKNK